MNSETKQMDCLIIGTGIAGCATALELSNQGVPVTMITRGKRPDDNASSCAQGGIVYRGEKDSVENLVADILKAGAERSYRAAAEIVAKEGPDLVDEILLQRLKVPFDRNKDDSLHLTGEAAHRIPRVIHFGDQTGRQIETAFLRYLSQQKNVEILTEHTAIDLLTLAHHSEQVQDLYQKPRCVGAYVLDQRNKNVGTFLAKETILATGGMGQLYLHTTNPPGARGDGLAMAYRTGARIMNLEYIQFHPTALYRKTSERFLVSEALRGEGAKLINQAGQEFMKRYDDRGTMAPRDILARAIHDEMLREGSQWVYLDISFKGADWIQERFPGVYAGCLERGIDITKEPIPVVPAAHFACGGIAVDLEGNTTIQNLKAVGETSCTGLHGANRLASTALLEDLVWGVRAARNTAQKIKNENLLFPSIRAWRGQDEAVDMDLLAQDWLTIKHTMWNYVGLVRTPKRLERAQRILRELADEVGKFYARSAISDDLVGLRNGAMVAQLILTAARRNHQSVGSHYLQADE